IIALSGSPAYGQDKRVDLAVGAVEISLLMSTTLQPFSEKKMALVRERGIAAKYVFNDDKNNLLAVINTFGSGANRKGLTKVGDDIRAGAEKQGAYKELKRELIKINGRKWLRMSFQDESLINDYVVTDWAGEYVLINFSYPIVQPNHKHEVERSFQSIRLGFIADIETIKPAVSKPV
ncbi:MAG: hypothetical protein ABR557_12960, partial [Pyrinomonadaceae bacterium]